LLFGNQPPEDAKSANLNHHVEVKSDPRSHRYLNQTTISQKADSGYRDRFTPDSKRASYCRE